MTPVQHDSTLETRRLTAREILQATIENARSELGRSVVKLTFSGLAGGMTMGLTGLAVAASRASLGEGGWRNFVSYLGYPIGFIAVIIGRAQLFTENTLYPVVLVLDERRHLVQMLRLWGVVFVANVVGAWLFAVLLTKTAALHPDILSAMVQLGIAGVSGNFGHFFWSGVVGGWLIALVAWTVSGSHWTIGQVAMIYLLTFLVGIGQFSHCIASSCEILSAVESGAVTVQSYFQWLLPTTLGNICGGVVIVSLLNYGQVRAL
ncbi:MAG TPA: formate/nitrite transporter family protein [Candidatus Sulfotelmatobacter sp.]|nr:formate/nitrite transporter family protein [Candidatus Sulfotelmatobacter sp.]